MKIQGYAFNSEVVCVACAQAAWASRDLRYPRMLTMLAITRDENGIPQGATDGDGNPIRPVFDMSDEICCACTLA